MKLLPIPFAIIALIFLSYSTGNAQEVAHAVAPDSIKSIRIEKEKIFLPEISLNKKIPLELAKPQINIKNPLEGANVAISKTQIDLRSNNHKLSMKAHSFDGIKNPYLSQMYYSIERKLGVKYDLSRKTSIEGSGMMGYTSLPMMPFPDKQYSVSFAFNYRPSDRFSIGIGATSGRFMSSYYLNPNIHTRFTPNRNWQLDLYSGINYSSPQFGHSFTSNSIYSNLRINYISDQGFYVYAQGFTSMAHGQNYLWMHHPYYYTSGLGGGIGYNIPGAGPVSIGVDYVYNPATQKLEPYVSFNPIGAIALLVKLISQAFE